MQNDNNETDQLIKRNKDAICKVAYSYLKNMDDVSDAYQTVFFNYYKNKPDFDNVEHEKAWFIRTTINVCKNMRTSAWHKKVDYLNDSETFDRIHAEAQVSENEESYGTVTKAVLRLPEKYRIVVHLFYYEEYTVEQIAKILDITKTNVKVRLNRARNLIKNDLVSMKKNHDL